MLARTGRLIKTRGHLTSRGNYINKTLICYRFTEPFGRSSMFSLRA